MHDSFAQGAAVSPVFVVTVVSKSARHSNWMDFIFNNGLFFFRELTLQIVSGRYPFFRCYLIETEKFEFVYVLNFEIGGKFEIVIDF